MVESSGLLNRRTVKNCTGGSNPPLSASTFNRFSLRLLLRFSAIVEAAACGECIAQAVPVGSGLFGGGRHRRTASASAASAGRRKIHGRLMVVREVSDRDRRSPGRRI